MTYSGFSHDFFDSITTWTDSDDKSPFMYIYTHSIGSVSLENPD